MPRRYSTGLARRQASDVLRMVRRHLQRLGTRLTRAERRAILAQRRERLGRNLIEAGALLRGTFLLLLAAGRGRPRPGLLLLPLKRLVVGMVRR
jgi:hypothetical protein